LGLPILTLEAAQRKLVLRDIGGEQFDGDLTAELSVLGQINFTHAAFPKQRANLIAT